MLNEYIGGESLEDPLVAESLLRRESPRGVPLEALSDETHEGVVRHVPQLDHYVLQTLFLLLRRQYLKGLLRAFFQLGKQMFSL